MSLNRVRVRSAPPLPELRAWIPIPQGTETIGKLKFHIAETVNVSRNLKLQPNQLVLELEDFQLLDASPITLLQDSDIILIKLVSHDNGPKRKAEQQYPSSAPQPKKRKLSTTSDSSSISTTSGDTTTTSGSTTTTSGSTTTTSGSSPSSSSTSEDSSSSDSPVVLPIRHKQVQNYVGSSFKSARRSTIPSVVPPGMGKPSTHSRNRRRRLKRLYEKQQARNTFQKADAKNAGQPSPAVKEKVVHDGLPFFPVDHSTSLQDLGRTPSKNVNDTHPLATFIPPSERLHLPSNIIITSIDVEDSTYQGHPVPEQNTQDEDLANDGPLDWDAIDKDWNMYTEITASTPLRAGMVVGWKAFGLNPLTLTPDASLLHLGKIIESVSDTIRIAAVSRGQVSFGHVIVEEEPEEELEKSKEDIVLEKWRIIAE